MDVVAIQDDNDREDGEIVDDFEDISDCSIPSVGKCDNELLRAISLSSISDSADEKSVHISRHDNSQTQDSQLLEVEGCHIAPHRTPQHRKRKRKHRQHHNAKRCFSPHTIIDLAANPSSSDEESRHVDKDMLRKLKEAVHIDKYNQHQNSLRTRLKAMINNEAPSGSDDEEIETLRTLALLSNSKSDTDKDVNDVEINEDEGPDPELVDILDDKELLELRSAALKSAVLKKHQERKKRKEQVVEQNADNTEVNKENTITNDIAKDNNNKQVNEKTIEIKSNEGLVAIPLQKNSDENKDISIEEDVDIMRAMLLASMSKKITNKIIPAVHPSPQLIPRRQHTAPNRVTNALLPKPTFPLPLVKPLIININNDSDSESDVKSPSKNHIEDPISQSVTEFLKLRRQQFEAKENGVGASLQSGNPPSNGLVLNTNTNTRRDVKLVARISSKENDLKKDMSSVKLLPKAQQREYQLLKRKLLLAKQKKLIEQIKSSEVKLVDSAQKTHTLKETLADLQVRENGRLRVKGKYDSLAGLLLLVNGASMERQHCEAHMKRLLNELTTAKGFLGQTHRKFTILVQKLIRAKDNIDARFTKTNCNSTKFTVTIPVLPTIPTPTSVTTSILRVSLATPTTVIPVVTSTPKKLPMQEMKLKISDIILETNALVRGSEADKLLQEIGTNVVVQNVDSEITEMADNVKTEDLILMDNLTDTFPKVEASLKYISPLDSRTSTSDPLGTICPYELFGDCKDAACKFVHCGKS